MGGDVASAHIVGFLDLRPLWLRRRTARSACALVVLAAAALGPSLAACGKPAPAGPAPTLVPTVDRLQVLGLLRSRAFDELDRLLRDLDHRAVSEPQAEVDAAHAYRAFWSANPALEGLIAEWVVHSPGAAAPLIAQAKHFARTGWVHRGGKWAEETPAARFEAMAEQHEHARQAALRALERDPRRIEAHALLVQIAGGDQAECERAAKQGLARVPASFRIREAWLDCLLPRWGGSYGAMRRVARQAQEHEDANPRLRLLLAAADVDRSDTLRRQDRFAEAMALLEDALAQGEHWRFYEERAWTQARQRRYALAVADLDRALVLNPQDPPLLLLRSRWLLASGRLAPARRDIELASEVDPADPDLPKARARLAKQEARVRGRGARSAGDASR